MDGFVERMIRKEVVVLAPLPAVWQAWTTAEGAMTFFAPKATVELTIGGRYEMLFDLDAPPGSQGSEGLKVLSFLPPTMLSFEWNAPPQYPTVRNKKTWVVVQLEQIGESATGVSLAHLGWQSGGEWPAVFDYFTRAWDTVLGRLQFRFATGPVDWATPYRPGGDG
ncbi:MAG: SRPBCC domain-containing protein [Anaerolineae bacterium]